MRAANVGLGLGLLCVLLACSEVSLRGGRTLDIFQLESATLLRSFDVAACTDASGTIVPWRNERVRLFKDGRQHFLVDEPAGLEPLRIDNGFRRGAAWIFQLIIEGSSGPDLLLEFQILDQASGSLQISESWALERRVGGFAAQAGAAVRRCKLFEGRPPGSAAADAPAQPSSVPPPAPPPSE